MEVLQLLLDHAENNIKYIKRGSGFSLRSIEIQIEFEFEVEIKRKG